MQGLLLHSIQLNQNQQIPIEQLWSEVPDIITAQQKKEAAGLFFSRRLHSARNNNYCRLGFAGSRLWRGDFCAGSLLTRKEKKIRLSCSHKNRSPKQVETLKLGWPLESSQFWNEPQYSFNSQSFDRGYLWEGGMILVTEALHVQGQRPEQKWAAGCLPTPHPEALRVSHTLLKGDLDSGAWPPPPQWFNFTKECSYKIMRAMREKTIWSYIGNKRRKVMVLGKWDMFRGQKIKLVRQVGATWDSFNFLVRVYTEVDTKGNWNHVTEGYKFLLRIWT